MNNLHTGESMEAVYWDGGDYLPDVLDAVNLHLRDYRTGDIHPIDPQLLDLLDSVSQLTGTKAPFEVLVVGGARTPSPRPPSYRGRASSWRRSASRPWCC